METGLLIKNDSQWPCYPELRKLRQSCYETYFTKMQSVKNNQDSNQGRRLLSLGFQPYARLLLQRPRESEFILGDGQAFVLDKVMVRSSGGKGVLQHDAEHAQPHCSFTADTGFVNALLLRPLLSSFFLSKISTENFHFHLREAKGFVCLQA